jgi:hypothetical protein
MKTVGSSYSSALRLSASALSTLSRFFFYALVSQAPVWGFCVLLGILVDDISVHIGGIVCLCVPPPVPSALGY